MILSLNRVSPINICFKTTFDTIYLISFVLLLCAGVREQICGIIKNKRISGDGWSFFESLSWGNITFKETVLGDTVDTAPLGFFLHCISESLIELDNGNSIGFIYERSKILSKMPCQTDSELYSKNIQIFHFLIQTEN